MDYNEYLDTETKLCKKFMAEVWEMQALNQFPAPFVILHIANERKSTGNRIMDMLHNKHLKAMGMMKGAPDYLILFRFGKVAAIEFKRDKTCKLSDSQKEFKVKCEDLLIPYLMTYSKDEAIGWIHELCGKL
jgi:hypothetical protein